MLRSVTMWALSALGAGTLAACGAQTSPPARSSSPSAKTLSVSEQARILAVQTSAYQAGVLRDGRVTRTEYLAATRDMRRCMVRADLPVAVDAITEAPDGELGFGWKVEARSRAKLHDAQRRGHLAFTRCQRLHRSDIGLIYANQRVVPAGERPARDAKMAACLRRAGLKLPARPRTLELARSLQSEAERGSHRGVACANADPDLFRIAAPLPAPTARRP